MRSLNEFFSDEETGRLALDGKGRKYISDSVKNARENYLEQREEMLKIAILSVAAYIAYAL